MTLLFTSRIPGGALLAVFAQHLNVDNTAGFPRDWRNHSVQGAEATLHPRPIDRDRNVGWIILSNPRLCFGGDSMYLLGCFIHASLSAATAKAAHLSTFWWAEKLLRLTGPGMFIIPQNFVRAACPRPILLMALTLLLFISKYLPTFFSRGYVPWLWQEGFEHSMVTNDTSPSLLEQSSDMVMSPDLQTRHTHTADKMPCSCSKLTNRLPVEAVQLGSESTSSSLLRLSSLSGFEETSLL